jgi:hypothetical protein
LSAYNYIQKLNGKPTVKTDWKKKSVASSKKKT